MNMRLTIACIVLLLGLPTSFFVDAAPNPNVRDQFLVVLKEKPVLGDAVDLKGKPGFERAKIIGSGEMALRAQRIRIEQDDLVRRIATKDPGVIKGRQFSYLVNAVEIIALPDVISEISRMDGVERVAPMRIYKPYLTSSADLWNLREAWALSDGPDRAGEGVFVAIIDTGVDPTHPAFDGTGFTYPEGFPKGVAAYTNEKLIAAYAFPPQSGPAGNATPLDTDGHGTNVASIATSNRIESPLGELAGTAPGAYVGNYKIFTTGQADSAQVIAAIEQAVRDGADVVNMSFGVPLFSDDRHDPETVAIRNAVQAGVIMVGAAGNASRDLAIGSPGQVDEVISVGSISNDHEANGTVPPRLLNLYVWADGERITEGYPVNFGSFGGPFTDPIVGIFDIQDADVLDGGSFGGEEDGRVCEDLVVDEPINSWLLVQRGVCDFVDKARRSREAGATGVLYYDNIVSDEPISPFAEDTLIPSMLTIREAGLLIKDRIQAGARVQVEIRGVEITALPSIPNRFSNFSSRGPSVDYTFKPEVVTIGEDTYGATQNDSDENSFSASGFDWYSGTSMSSPRIAGLAALLRQQNPEWPVSWIKSAIVNTAAMDVDRANGTGLASMTEQGNGRVLAADALQADTLAVPTTVSFGVLPSNTAGNEVRRFRVINPTEQPCAYSLTTTMDSLLVLSIEPQTFELEPMQSIEIEVQLTALGNGVVADSEQRIAVTNSTTGSTIHVPVWARIIGVTDEPGGILLIDDDQGVPGGESFESFYIQRLEAIGESATHWGVADRAGNYPPFETLQQYDAVIWFMSGTSLFGLGTQVSRAYIDGFNERHLFESDLMRYMGNGGRLLVSGMDFFDGKEEAIFAREVFGAQMDVHDHGANSITGVDGNPVGDGIAQQTIIPGVLDDFTDLVSTVGDPIAQPAFLVNGDPDKIAGVSVEACIYRAVFLTFPIEALPPEGAEDILASSLTWLREAESGRAQVTSVFPAQVEPESNTEAIEITITGEGFTFVDGYRAEIGFVPVENLERIDCTTLTGTLPSSLPNGTYALNLVHGNGMRLELVDALIIGPGDNTRVPNWELY